MILSETPRRKRVNQLVHWGHWFTLFNIIIAIVIASVYVVSSPQPPTPLANSYLFANWFSHIALITFMGFVILIFPLCYWIQKASYVRGVAAFSAAVGLALLALDALFFNRHGIHISTQSTQFVDNDSFWNWRQWVLFGVMFVAWFTFQLVMANALWKRLNRFKNYKIAPPVIGFFITCFIFSHGGHIWADARLYQPIIQQDNMFPLSYPATAKTLMSRYGLLDLDAYLQRRQLQFDYSFNDLTYPSSPVYCSIDDTKQTLLLLSTQPLASEAMKNAQLTFQKAAHYNFSDNLDGAIFSAIYGLPGLYKEALAQQRPLLFDLPTSRGAPPVTYSNDSTNIKAFNQFKRDWDEFAHAIQTQASSIAVGILLPEQITQLLSNLSLDNLEVLVVDVSQKQAPAYANFALNRAASSLEDLAPTLLGKLGCDAKAELYSTGRSMENSTQSWIVSSQMENIVIVDDQKMITIDVAGHAVIRDLESGQQLAEDLNMNLITQAIKQVSRFIN